MSPSTSTDTTKERDPRGRFAPGCKPGPGRQPLTLELDRLNPKLEQRKLIRWLHRIAPYPERFTKSERDLILAAAMVLVQHGAPMMSIMAVRALIAMDAADAAADREI